MQASVQMDSKQKDAVKVEINGKLESNEDSLSNTTSTTSTDNFDVDTKTDRNENGSSDEARVSLGFVDEKFIRQLMPS